MTWWAWIVGGSILLGAELAFVDAQFYLVFVGLAAILVGVALGLVAELPGWAQWAGFAALALFFWVTFRQRIYERLRGRLPGMITSHVGATLELPQALAPGAHCQVEHAGTFWTAVNDGDAPLAQGARVRVCKVDGLTLRVRADASSGPS